MKPPRQSLQLERAAAHLLRARSELDDAAHALAGLSDEHGERLQIASDLAAAQARLAEAIAAAIHAPQHAALDDLLGALTGQGKRAARTQSH
jgi:hypothetical protein